MQLLVGKHIIKSPWPLHFKHSHWWRRRNRSKFASHLAWGTHGVCQCKMGVKSTWIPTWHRMDHVSWSLRLFFQNHLLEVGLTQNQKTMALYMLTTFDLSFLCNVWGPAWIEIHWNNIQLRARARMTSQYTWGSMTTSHNFGGVLGQHSDTSCWAFWECT